MLTFRQASSICQPTHSPVSSPPPGLYISKPVLQGRIFPPVSNSKGKYSHVSGIVLYNGYPVTSFQQLLLISWIQIRPGHECISPEFSRACIQLIFKTADHSRIFGGGFRRSLDHGTEEGFNLF
jgi:hypothetical protein